MKTIKKGQVFSFLLVLCLLGQAFAGPSDDTRLTKRISKGFRVSGPSKLELNNRYGEVIMDTWQKDSIKVEIIVTTYGKNELAAEKLMDRVEFDFRQVDEFVSVESVFDRSKGFFTDLWNSVGDYSKNLLNKSKIKVDYKVYMPANTNLDLVNKFGDVFLPDLSGKVTVDLTNGALQAGHLSGKVVLNISFGEATIKSLDEATLSFKSADFELKKAQKIDLRSSSSDIAILDISTLRINSRTDKININRLSILEGSSSFTKIKLERLDHSINLDMNYGFLNVFEVPADVASINITGNSTDAMMMFQKESYVQFEVTAKDEKLSLPRDVTNIKKRYTDGREKFVTTSGHLGNPNRKPLHVTIDAQGGEVSLNYTQLEMNHDQSLNGN